MKRGKNMQIKCIPVGYLQANCYIVIKNNKAILIDPGDEPDKIEQYLKNLEIVGILVTHNHFDHTGSLAYFEEKYHLKANQKIEDFSYEVIKTPGHTKDSKTFYFPEEKIMFTGDFLFKETIGRMDLEGGSVMDMKKSLEKIAEYDDAILLYPGHGEPTDLGHEKSRFSYYLKEI